MRPSPATIGCSLEPTSLTTRPSLPTRRTRPIVFVRSANVMNFCHGRSDRFDHPSLCPVSEGAGCAPEMPDVGGTAACPACSAWCTAAFPNLHQSCLVELRLSIRVHPKASLGFGTVLRVMAGARIVRTTLHTPKLNAG